MRRFFPLFAALLAGASPASSQMIAQPAARQAALSNCAEIVDEAMAGRVPTGSTRWGLTGEAYRAALATTADPAIAPADLEVAVIRSILTVAPGLEAHFRIPSEEASGTFIIDHTPPATLGSGATAVLFRCTIRNDGTGWIPHQLLLGRPYAMKWIAFPLSGEPEAQP